VSQGNGGSTGQDGNFQPILSSPVMTESDDEELRLSSHAQAALAEFLAERQAQERKLDTQGSEDDVVDINSFAEDWQVQQFWPELTQAFAILV